MDYQTDAQKTALQRAANVLQYKNRSRQALLERLIDKGVAQEDAEYAVIRLEELGYLNDEAYARLVVENLKNRGYGAYRIKQELKQKKLGHETIEDALAGFEADDDRLEAFIHRRLGEPPFDRKDIKRVNDALIRRGFSWEETRQAIKQYISSIEADFEED